MNLDSRNSAERGPDRISETIALLEKEHAELTTRAADIKVFLDQLRGMRTGGGGTVSATSLLPPVIKDEFKGDSLRQAFETYLRGRRGHKIPFNKVLDDLLLAGVTPGKIRRGQSDPRKLLEHKLKILCSNSPRFLGREPSGKLHKIDARDILVWFADAADQPPKKPRKKG